MEATYKERQYFEGKAVYVLLALGFGSALYGWGQSLFAGTANWQTSASYLLIMATTAALIWWLRRLRLKVSINEKRIKFKMFPYHRQAQRIHWEEVVACELVKTPHLAQWHGSNLHLMGEAWYSLTGRNGLAIETKDGRRLFIGCKDVDKLAETLEQARLG